MRFAGIGGAGAGGDSGYSCGRVPKHWSVAAGNRHRVGLGVRGGAEGIDKSGEGGDARRLDEVENLAALAVLAHQAGADQGVEVVVEGRGRRFQQRLQGADVDPFRARRDDQAEGLQAGARAATASLPVRVQGVSALSWWGAAGMGFLTLNGIS